MNRDPYLILNVGPTATEAQISNSYRKLARIYHPDLNERSDASQRMREINWAYEVLSNPRARRTYELEHGTARPDNVSSSNYRSWARTDSMNSYGAPTSSTGGRHSYAQIWAWKRFVEDRRRWEAARSRNRQRTATWSGSGRSHGMNPSDTRILRRGVMGPIAGPLAAIGILLVGFVADGGAMFWSGLMALVIGCRLSAVRDPSLSAQNAAAVGGSVFFLLIVASWAAHAPSLSADSLVAIILWAFLSSVLLGAPIGAWLGRMAAWTKS